MPSDDVRSLTVLHVDDAPIDQYRRRKALERAGFGVLEAATGADAIAAVAASAPDIVLLDVKLPGCPVCDGNPPALTIATETAGAAPPHFLTLRSSFAFPSQQCGVLLLPRRRRRCSKIPRTRR